MAGYAILARLDREADTGVLGATSLWRALTLRCRMSKGQALKRVARAGRSAVRNTLRTRAISETSLDMTQASPPPAAVPEVDRYANSGRLSRPYRRRHLRVHSHTGAQSEVTDMRRLIGTAALAVAAAATAAGCSFGGNAVPANDVAKEISAQLKAQTGKAPKSVTCPSDLADEVGATLRCELNDGRDTYGVSVTVTEVKGDNVNFDLKVDGEPS